MNIYTFITLFLSILLSACGGSSGSNNSTNTESSVNEPTPTVVPEITATPAPTQTPAPTETPAPTQTPAPAPTQTPAPTETPAPTLTPAPTQTPSPTQTPNPTPQPLSITAENALELTASVTTSVLKSEVPISTELAGLLTSLSSASESEIDHSSLLKTLLNSNASNAEKTSFPNEPVDCGISGTLSYTGSISDSESLSAGDQINLTFNQCSSGKNIVTNGTILYTITAFSGNTSFQGAYDLSYLMEFDVEYQEPSQTVGITGEISTGVSLTDAIHNTGLRSSELLVTVNGNEQLINDYVYVQSFLFESNILSLVASGTLSSDEIGGSITFETASALNLTPTSDNPLSGTFIISDELGASVKLNILDGGVVQLDIDTDRDGIKDETQMANWDDIDNFFE